MSGGLLMAVEAGYVVLPGDTVGTLENAPTGAAASGKRAVIRLGAGVEQRDRWLMATKAGEVLHDTRRSKVWVSGNQRRYEPVLEEAVIGVVTDRHAEEYRIDIRGTDTAMLPALAFEGATKRNKPSLVVGSSVYSRITLASKDMECEASCVEPGSSRSWVSGETLYGELKGGNVVDVSLRLSRELQADNSAVLSRLGAAVPFESAVGANGRVWIKSGSTRSNVLLCLLVSKADELPLDKWNEHVTRVLAQFRP
jgi:exosome complex component RRP40